MLCSLWTVFGAFAVSFPACIAANVIFISDGNGVAGVAVLAAGIVCAGLSDKVFIADSDTGNIGIPETASGGKCKIKTGSIGITVENQLGFANTDCDKICCATRRTLALRVLHMNPSET